MDSTSVNTNPRRRRLAASLASESPSIVPVPFPRRRLNLSDQAGLLSNGMQMDPMEHSFFNALIRHRNDSDTDDIHTNPRSSRRSKRPKFEHSLERDVKPHVYGRKGQLEAGELMLEMVHSDGGAFEWERDSGTEEDYDPENVLKNDAKFYRSKNSRCNLLLRHQAGTVFHLSKLIIKGPDLGGTSPVTQGLVFVGMNDLDLLCSAGAYKAMYVNSSGERIPRPGPWLTDEETRMQHREMSEYLNRFIGDNPTQPPSHIPASMFPTGLGVDWSRFEWSSFTFEGLLDMFPDFVERLRERHFLTHPERVPRSNFMRSLQDEEPSSSRQLPVQPMPGVLLTTAGPEWDIEMEDVDCDGHDSDEDTVDQPLPIERLNGHEGRKSTEKIMKPVADFYLKSGKSTATLHFSPPL
jgi:hypothetical protein